VGLITTVALLPKSGYNVASTEAAPKSCIKFKVIDPDFKPAILVLHSPPNAVVSKSSAERVNSTELRLVEKFVPLINMLKSVAANFGILFSSFSLTRK
jgi:hypothetical protein